MTYKPHIGVEDVPRPEHWRCSECGYDRITQPTKWLLGGFVKAACPHCKAERVCTPVKEIAHDRTEGGDRDRTPQSG